MTDKTAYEKWLEACAARFIECGIDVPFSKEISETLAETQKEWNGDDVAEWDAPRDAANDEMSYWEAE